MTQLSVKEYLLTLPKDQTVYYRPNTGNAGDSLIASGTWQLFDDIGLDHKVVTDVKFDATGKIFIYGGGGNLVDHYYDARNALWDNHKKASKLILLPHTVKGNEDLICQLGSNVTIFAREKYTFEYLQSFNSGFHLILDNDLALSLDVVKLLNKKAPSFPEVLVKNLFSNRNVKLIPSQRISPKRILGNFIFELFSSVNRNQQVLNAFREDVEKR